MVKSTKEIVFKHIKDYYPDDERWETEKWVSKDKLEELINWGDIRRKDNTIFGKSVDEVNEDWIDKIEELIGDKNE